MGNNLFPLKVGLRWSGHVRPRQGTEICNFGAPFSLEALQWIFCFFSSIFSSIYVQFSKTSPLKSGESSEKSSGENRVKSCHVCGCHGFFGPEMGFCQWAEMGPKVGQKWIFGCKSGSKCIKTHFCTPFKPISAYSRKPTFYAV